MKKWGIGIGILAVVLMAGYWVVVGIVHKKVDAALKGLPDSLRYSALHVRLLTGSVIIDSLQGHGVSIDRVAVHGIGFLRYWRSHQLRVSSVVLEGSLVHRQGLSLKGRMKIDSVYGTMDSLQFAAIHADVDSFRYAIPDAEEVALGRHLELDSRKKIFRLETLRIAPVLDPFQIGRKRGYQVDVVEAASAGLMVEGLDVMELLHQRLTADKISIRENHIHIFRDRRLRLAGNEKPMPVAFLKNLPVTLRVGSVEIGPTFFAYEEFPASGDRSSTLKIYHLRGHIAPLLNCPKPGDPPYITISTEGSLMNSGTVDATTKMPLHAGDPYLVVGAFHNLDVTSLNDPAENLGKLHLESGMLNYLGFHFVMSSEKSTGNIVGEYHNLVVDKLKDNGKVAKLKSFALKKFIIPRDKDKRLPVKKRTGKVDYQHDPTRNFSYYLLHSLLVGVKSSFSLGFLLPG